MIHQEPNKEQILVVNLSGRGDKDIFTVDKVLKKRNAIMSRFETKFAELAAKRRGFVPFVTLCDPTFDRSFEIICTLVENGADALELGFPFSDPLLDGPVIQAANNRALNAGHKALKTALNYSLKCGQNIRIFRLAYSFVRI